MLIAKSVMIKPTSRMRIAMLGQWIYERHFSDDRHLFTGIAASSERSLVVAWFIRTPIFLSRSRL